MELNERLQNIIDYIEFYLQRKEEDISTEAIAQMAGCSYSFFQKIFAYMTGITFREYIRNRKLTLAGYDLKSTHMKVVDISYKYGYDSPTSFTRAFQTFHGIPPKDARKENTTLRVFAKLKADRKGEYTWRLEKKEAFTLLGKWKTIDPLHKAYEIPNFWAACHKEDTIETLKTCRQTKGLYGVYANDDALKYAIMATCDEDRKGLSKLHIPAQTWAVFDCYGEIPMAIQQGWEYLYEEWLLRYPFAHADCPEMEWYRDEDTNDKYSSQIWIPIQKEDA